MPHLHNGGLGWDQLFSDSGLRSSEFTDSEMRKGTESGTGTLAPAPSAMAALISLSMDQFCKMFSEEMFLPLTLGLEKTA